MVGTNNVKDGDKMRFGEGNIGICLRVVFIIFGIAAFCCSISCLGVCNFFIYEPRDPPAGIQDTRPDLLVNVTIATIGLFKYDSNYQGCRDLPENKFDSLLSGAFTAAQIGCSLAVFLGAAALALLLIDLVCCRFPCSRFLISILFLAAFIGQSLTFLVFAAPLCDPNYVNGPFPCSPDTGTFISIAACFLYLLAGFLVCCIPKPLPIILRVKNYLENDETDGCCVLCKKTPKDEKEDKERAPDEEEGGTAAVVAAGGAEVPPEEEEEPPTVETLQADQAHAAVAADLAAVRRGKQEEIEKQLELLSKYKELLSEEEYNEKVTALIHALPDPNTYDAFTKTNNILPAEEEEEEEEEGTDDDDVEEGEGEEGDETKEQEGEEEEKKSLGQKMVAPVTAVGSAMGSAMKGVKDTVTGSKNKTAEEDAPKSSDLAPPETG